MKNEPLPPFVEIPRFYKITPVTEWKKLRLNLILEHRESIVDNWISCEVCRALFPTTVSLKNHTISAHQEKKEKSLSDKVLCTFCPQTLYNLTMYYKHANTKHPNLGKTQF